MGFLLVRLVRSRQRAMVALEYLAIAIVLIPAVIGAFTYIGHGMIQGVQTKIQTQLTFSNLPDQDLSGGVYGGGVESPPGP